MPTGKLPGMSYEDMFELIRTSQKEPTKVFSIELLIAIFWEESLFNNAEQEQGTAWGFGQTEPAEFYKLELPQKAPDLADSSYGVLNIPPRVYEKKTIQQKKADGTVGDVTVTKVKLAPGRSLTPEQSVQISSGLLYHMFKYTKSKQSALNAYAGVGYKGTDVPTKLATSSDREKIVQGWLDCEAYLQGIPEGGWAKYVKEGMYQKSKGPPDDWPTFIKKGLAKARPFHLNDKAFDDRLFPKDPATGQWRPRIAGFLVDYMKQRGLTAGVPAVPDNIPSIRDIMGDG
jgi:hypothetical protein